MRNGTSAINIAYLSTLERGGNRHITRDRVALQIGAILGHRTNFNPRACRLDYRALLRANILAARCTLSHELGLACSLPRVLVRSAELNRPNTRRCLTYRPTRASALFEWAWHILRYTVCTGAAYREFVAAALPTHEAFLHS